LDKKSQAKIYRYLMLLQDNGHDLPLPYADHVQGKIRELRVVTQAGNVRIFYFFFISNDIILLHAFKKKTQELPIREIEKAERNMNDFTVRYGRSEFK
jgi:phage-related protein